MSGRQRYYSRLLVGRRGCGALVSDIRFTRKHIRGQLTASLSQKSTIETVLVDMTSLIPIPKYFESEWSYAQFHILMQSAHISLTQQAAARDANPSGRGCEYRDESVGWARAHWSVDVPCGPCGARFHKRS